jgi:hypothetical protein
MPYRCKNDNPGSVLLWFNRQPQFSDPISRRAWTYQESILSRRLLTFGTHQTRWSCRALPPTNARVDGWTDGNLYVMSGFVDWLAIETRKGKQQESFAKHWKSVIEHYTGRNLSYAGDRLAAISAVAKKLQKETGKSRDVAKEILQQRTVNNGYFASKPQKTTTNSEYLAGMWRHCLPELLMWDACRCIDPPTYIAPSWSWASMIGQVYFLHSSSGPHGVEVVDVKIETPAPHDPHGPVTGGRLKLRGMVSVAMLKYEWDESLRKELPVCRPPLRKGSQGFSLERKSEFVRGVLDLEPPELVDDGQEITVWMLRLDGNHSSGSNHGLLLLKLAGGAFCRIGIYSGCRYGRMYIPWRPMDLILSRRTEGENVDRFRWKMGSVTVV